MKNNKIINWIINIFKILGITVAVLLVLFVINIVGNRLELYLTIGRDSVNPIKCFIFEQFNETLPIIATIITVYLGYMQFQKNKEFESVNKLYEQDLERAKREDELFYEYFNSITNFTLIKRGKTEDYWDLYEKYDTQYWTMMIAGDKLDVLTSINLFKINEDCFSCKNIKENYVNLIKHKEKISNIRNEINDEIKKIFINLDINDVSASVEDKKESHIAFFKTHVAKLIKDKIKGDLYGTYMAYKQIRKQYIEERKQLNYKNHKACSKCPHSKLQLNENKVSDKKIKN